MLKELIHKLKTKNKQKIDFRYDLVVSLGEDCAVRKDSMPFDWIDGAPLSTRVQLITNNFENWLRKDVLEFYEVHTEIEEERNFSRYKNTITSINFQHDFLVDVPFDEYFENVKTKYDRRIGRLQEAFNSSQRILFVWITRNDVNSDEDIISAAKKLNEYSPNARVDLFYIQHDPSMDMHSFKYESLNENITKFYLNNSSVNFKTPFLAFRGNIPQIIQIFWEFNLISYKDLFNQYSVLLIRKIGKVLKKLADKIFSFK